MVRNKNGEVIELGAWGYILTTMLRFFPLFSN